MKRIFLFLFLLCNNIEAQTWFVGWDTVPAKFRLDISPFQFGYGPWGINTKTDMPEQSSFILTSTTKGFGGFHMDIQAFFKDKIGIETGFDFVGGSLDEKKIRSELQNHIPNYVIEFPKTDYDGGNSPFRGGYDYRIFKIGLIGFIRCNKIVILPYLNYLYNIESDYPNLTVIFTDPSNNSSFNRIYKFYNTNSNGIKVGASFRGYFKNQNIKRKHSNIYMQLRAEFVYLKTNGYGYYLDKDVNNNEIKSPSHNFSQNAYAFVLGFTLGGLDLHW
ncbi:MAG: hypothetical protein JNM51_13665 [Bacteroidia bacterium]|nr:hypothetical protein [Bacteroidia bacterium]